MRSSAALSVTPVTICAGSGEGKGRPALRPAQPAAAARIASATTMVRPCMVTSCAAPGSAERHDTPSREPVDLVAREPELGEHLGGVLAEERRGAADRGGRRRRADGEGEHLRLAVAGLVDLRDEAQVLHLRVLEDLIELVDRPRGDLRRLEALYPLGRRRAPERRLDPRLQLLV